MVAATPPISHIFRIGVSNLDIVSNSGHARRSASTWREKLRTARSFLELCSQRGDLADFERPSRIVLPSKKISGFKTLAAVNFAKTRTVSKSRCWGRAADDPQEPAQRSQMTKPTAAGFIELKMISAEIWVEASACYFNGTHVVAGGRIGILW